MSGSIPHEAPPARNERLASVQAFARFVEVVTPVALGWCARLRGPASSEKEEDDVLQAAFLRAFEKREAYDPARSSWEGWFYGFFVGEVLNHRKRWWRRTRRVDVAVGDLPETAAGGPDPEEETEQNMMRRLAEKCLGTLDERSREILMAKDVDGLDMESIAGAHGISVAAAYRCHREGKDRLKAAIAREQTAKRDLGLAVLPISVDQILAAGGGEPHRFPEAALRRVWKALEPLVAADLAAGRLGDDGTELPRSLRGPDPSPGLPGGLPQLARWPRLARLARALLDPRVLPVLTGLGGAAGGTFVTYEIMKGSAEPRSGAVAEVRPREPVPSAGGASSPDGAPVSPDGSPASDALQVPADAGLPAASLDGKAADQALSDRALTLYQERRYAEAIAVFQVYASRFPNGRFAAAHERLWTLSLIAAGRTDAARARIERLRAAEPGSPLLKELDQALISR